MLEQPRFDEQMAASDHPQDVSSEAMAAIEIALDVAGGSHADALDLIVTSEKVSGEAKAIAGEVLG